MPALATISSTARPERAPARPGRPETLRLGYVPLVDAAPLLVAEALGLFEKQGVRVRLSRELGWGSVRDQVLYGQLDAAHAPGGLLFSILCGTHAPPHPVATDLVLNLQGNAITLSRRLWQQGVRDARTLRGMIRSEAPRKRVFAVVSAFSSHLILLRGWLHQAGISPDADVRFAILPPPLVGQHLREGLIDGFCAGEPWNSLAALAGEGWIAETSATLSPRHPEKVLLATASLMEREEYRPLREALVAACRWCELPENRKALVDLLHERLFPRMDRAVLANSLIGPLNNGLQTRSAEPPFHCFHRHDANAASAQRAAWYFDGLAEAGSLSAKPEHRRACLSAFREPNT